MYVIVTFCFCRSCNQVKRDVNWNGSINKLPSLTCASALIWHIACPHHHTGELRSVAPFEQRWHLGGELCALGIWCSFQGDRLSSAYATFICFKNHQDTAWNFSSCVQKEPLQKTPFAKQLSSHVSAKLNPKLLQF